jgi:glycolate oxidase subunit GlcD
MSLTTRDIATLRHIVGTRAAIQPVPSQYLEDATEQQIRGAAELLLKPKSTKEVAALVKHCYRRGIAMHTRGAGSGLAGGAIPKLGSVIISLERMNKIRSFSPEYWRMEAEAGVITKQVHETAKKKGLLFPPDPGAAWESHIGGNIATNAGGAHTFKYGVTGHWVTGLEVVTAHGDVLKLGGPLRKDVAAYDLKSLFIGSEGTLGIVTAAWLKLVPLPEVSIPVVATFTTIRGGSRALEDVFRYAQLPTAAELLDGPTLREARDGFPGKLPATAEYMLLLEAEGGPLAAKELAAQLSSRLKKTALSVWMPKNPQDIEQLWTWRYGIYHAISKKLGGKVSEDISVPLEQLPAALEGVYAIGKRHNLPACNWGHAGDGNIHATFLVDWHNKAQLKQASVAVGELFDLALRLGGSISGEHGVGRLKRPWLPQQLGSVGFRYQRDVKRLFDPKNLFNPGVKV